MGFAVQIPLDAAEQMRCKADKKRNLSEPKASLFRFPLCTAFVRVPRRGSGLGVAFFAYFFGEAKKEVARRGQSRHA